MKSQNVYVLVCCVLLSCLQLPSVWLPLQLIGSTAGAMVAFVLPGTLALTAAGWRPVGAAGLWGLVLVLFGLLLAAAGIASAILHE